MPQTLSRACIHDTLIYKRDKAQWQRVRFATSLYNINIRLLRAGQLAPYVETMEANRYGKRMALKRSAPEVVVVVRGGLVQSVLSNNPYTTVFIADYDRDPDDPDEEAVLNDAEERASASDMHEVY